MNEIYGYDIGNNRKEVPDKDSFDSLVMEVDFKQNNLSATNGIMQDDCNEVDVTGYYYISTTTLNGPGVDGILSVVRLNESGSIVVQEVLNTAGSIKYTRVKANSVWGDWRPNYYNMDTIIDMLNANIEQNAGNISQLQADVATKQNAEDDTLVTDDKTIPGAINELATEASILATEVSNKQPKNDPSLNTQSKLVAGAINELKSAIAQAESLITDLDGKRGVTWQHDSGRTVISMSGDLTAVGEYMKSHFMTNRLITFKVEPTDATGYFGTSSFGVIALMSSANYGFCQIQCDAGGRKSFVVGCCQSGTWTFNGTSMRVGEVIASASYADFSSKILAILGDMDEGERVDISIKPSGSWSPVDGWAQTATLYRNARKDQAVQGFCLLPSRCRVGYYYSGAWHWQQPSGGMVTFNP